jgi:hypothetical protein
MLRAVKVEAAVYTVASGIVGLSPDQARTRLHNLMPVKGKVDTREGSKTRGAGEYEVVNPIQFKRGEEFGYSGQVGKDGQLRDPDAERLKALQEEEDKEKAVKAAVRAAEQKLRDEYAGKLQKAVSGMRAELEVSLRKELEVSVRAELEPKIRAELAAAQK